MNAAETCPTKAIIVENKDTKERLYPLINYSFNLSYNSNFSSVVISRRVL